LPFLKPSKGKLGRPTDVEEDVQDVQDVQDVCVFLCNHFKASDNSCHLPAYCDAFGVTEIEWMVD
jgi:hypothetical protein